MKHIIEQSSRLAYLNEKLEELHVEENKGNQLSTQQQYTLNDLQNKLDKLKSIAKGYGVDLDTHEEEQRHLKALEDKNAALTNQKRVL